jgi:hypothetical protein
MRPLRQNFLVKIYRGGEDNHNAFDTNSTEQVGPSGNAPGLYLEKPACILAEIMTILKEISRGSSHFIHYIAGRGHSLNWPTNAYFHIHSNSLFNLIQSIASI